MTAVALGADPLARLVAVLAVLSLFCIGLGWARLDYTGEDTYSFLIWNLFLAWIPLVVALAMELAHRRSARRGVVLGLGIVWLLFFPNAPYIVTDFVHLREPARAPLWFDVLLIAAFAWTGLLLGFLSLSRVQGLVASARGTRTAWLFAVGALVLASFGIYIGRFEVRNSWDVIVRPVPLARETWHELTSPASYARAVGLTASYSTFLVLGYATVVAFSSGLVAGPGRRSAHERP